MEPYIIFPKNPSSLADVAWSLKDRLLEFWGKIMYRHKDILSVAASLSRVSLDNWNCSLSASRLPPFEQLIQGLDEAMETERCRNWSPAGDQLPPFSAPLGLHYLIKSVVRPKILTFIWKMILPNQKNQSLRVWLLNAFKDQIMEVLSSHTLIL